MALRELLARFGIEIEGAEKLEQVHVNLGEMIEKLKQFGEIFAVSLIGERMHEFVEEQIRLGDELHVTAERLGVTTDELQRFQLAGRLSGMSTEEATTALRFFNRTMGSLNDGGGELAGVFAKMQVDTKALSEDSVPLVDKIGQIADGFANLKTHGEKTAFAMKVFGRGGVAMVPILSEGREKVKELFEEMDALGGGMSKEFAESAKKAEHASVRLKFAWQGLKSRIAMELLPGFTDMTNRMMKMIVGIIKFSKETYGLRTAIIGLKLSAFVMILMKIVKVMKLAEGGVFGFVKGLLRLGWIGALVLVLYLLFDDLYTLFKGGDSVIGKLIDQLFGVGTSADVVKIVKDAWEDLVTWWEGDGSAGVQFFARTVIGGLILMIDALVTSMRNLFQVAKAGKKYLSGDFAGGDKDIDAIGGQWSGFMDRQASIFGPGGFVDGPRRAISQERMARPGEIGPPAPSTIKIENNISGVSDPKAAAEHAARGTREALDSTRLRSTFGAIPGGA